MQALARRAPGRWLCVGHGRMTTHQRPNASEGSRLSGLGCSNLSFDQKFRIWRLMLGDWSLWIISARQSSPVEGLFLNSFFATLEHSVGEFQNLGPQSACGGSIRMPRLFSLWGGSASFCFDGRPGFLSMCPRPNGPSSSRL